VSIVIREECWCCGAKLDDEGECPELCCDCTECAGDCSVDYCCCCDPNSEFNQAEAADDYEEDHV